MRKKREVNCFLGIRSFFRLEFTASGSYQHTECRHGYWAVGLVVGTAHVAGYCRCSYTG